VSAVVLTVGETMALLDEVAEALEGARGGGAF
jgi:hypothetical protein